MEENLKQLLLKDLCARLPYRVKVKTPYNVAEFVGIVDRKGVRKDIDYTDIVTDKQTYPLRYCQPYLRPMSSMTEEEIKTYYSYCEYNDGDFNGEILYFDTIESFDYLTSIHIDYRGLIPMGLALEAPDDMYGKI